MKIQFFGQKNIRKIEVKFTAKLQATIQNLLGHVAPTYIHLVCVLQRQSICYIVILRQENYKNRKMTC